MGTTRVARYTRTLAQLDTVFRITVDQDLENEMIVVSCKKVTVSHFSESLLLHFPENLRQDHLSEYYLLSKEADYENSSKKNDEENTGGLTSSQKLLVDFGFCPFS